MNILVTNDDGIDSPGLWALAEAMSRVGDTLVVAPNSQQSGVGTAVSLHSETSIEEVPSSIPNVKAYAIGGTPTDCVLLGIRRLRGDRRFGLLVSGINRGANMGRDIPFSGTVMATLGGYFRRIPSIAVSLAVLDTARDPDFRFAATVAEHMARMVQSGTLPADAILNTNVPDIPLDQIRGIVTTRTASGNWVRLAPVATEGGTRYRSDGRATEVEYPEGTDIWAVRSGLVSITPLRMEVTDHERMPALAEHLPALESDLLGSRGGG